MRSAPALAFLLLAACSGSSFNYDGEPIAEYFPLDGQRWWEYRQCAAYDTGTPVNTQVYSFYDATGCTAPAEGLLRTEKYPEVQKQGSVEIVTLNTYRESADGSSTPVYSVKWSSDNSKGLRIYGWADLTTGVETTYDPPIQAAAYKMNVGDEVETTTGGFSFVGRFEDTRTDCPNNWSGLWDQCVHITISADGASAPFLGDYWIGASYGTTAFKAAGESDVWVLDDADWQANEN